MDVRPDDEDADVPIGSGEDADVLVDESENVQEEQRLDPSGTNVYGDVVALVGRLDDGRVPFRDKADLVYGLIASATAIPKRETIIWDWIFRAVFRK